MNIDRQPIAEKCINTIRTLSIDAVQKANSGHPGAPLGLAPAGYTLWTRIINHNPDNPNWANRDRFILSAGHASMLLYSLLHLSGYDVSLDDIKNFRQLHSKTPGHPEYGQTPGVEMTTGQLGQGFANGVGMAMSEKYLAEYFNRTGYDVIDHYTYAIVSDGDIMEGVCAEAASLAGHLELGKLIYVYDSNTITIEGQTDLAFSENVKARFEAYNWHVEVVENGNTDLDGLAGAIEKAKQERCKPSLVILKTSIGFGSPNKEGSSDSHGAPLGAEEVKLTKKALGWPEDEHFLVPEGVKEHFSASLERCRQSEKNWNGLFAKYRAEYPELARQWDEFFSNGLPANWDELVKEFEAGKSIATRSASGEYINLIAPEMPNLVGGSADLGPSNKTVIKGAKDFLADSPEGRNIHFGIREHAMGAIMNGMSVYGGVICFGGTFFMFADYMRPAIRIAALMGIRCVYVFTHDSIGVGEDGPTHQPIEHLAVLRAIPNLTVIRPADANETVWAWRKAVENTTGPTALVLTRQNVPVLDQKKYTPAQKLEKGAYVLKEAASGTPELILIGTGSEVSLCLESAELLEKDGISTRVVSMPSWELFEQQDDEYKNSVLPQNVKARMGVEAGISLGWERYTGCAGCMLSIETFGQSAPASKLFEEFGFTASNAAAKAKQLVQNLK